MLLPPLNLRKSSLIRLALDFAMVHLAMGLSIIIAISYHGATADANTAFTVATQLTTYYTHLFLPLSLLFPCVYFAAGFYNAARGYSARHKFIVVIRGVLTSILLFLTANFLFFREQLIPRSAVLSFCGIAIIFIAGSRFLKRELELRYIVQSRSATPEPAPNQATLVVGGAGYIGSNLVRDLLVAGKRVRVLDNFVYGNHALVDVLPNPNLEMIQGDCRNIQSVVSAIKGCDSIVHLAAIVGDPACDQDRQTALEVNYAATRMLIEIAKGNGVTRFIFASSCSVYGATDLLMDEKSVVTPISVYAQTKIDSERALLEARTPTFHPTILRLATVFGYSHRPRFDLVVNLLTARAAHEGKITIFNGDQWRPFIHVRDVAKGIAQVLEAPIEVVGGTVYNLGDSNMNRTLTQVAQAIQTFYPDTTVEFKDNTDRRNYRVDFTKIKNEIGFECTISIERGITELKQALETGAITDYTNPLYHNDRFLRTLGMPPATNEIDTRLMAAFGPPASPPRATMLFAPDTPSLR